MNKSSQRRVWIPNHPEYEWWPGEVISEDADEIMACDDSGQEFKIKKNKALEVDATCMNGIPDLLLLGDLNEGSLLHNIRERYAQDKIYTAIGGPIIISLNPYKRLPIYSKEHVQKYRKDINQMNSGNLTIHDIDPHLYKVAEISYQSLMDSKKNQSIIISGESGSGKTESAKIILKYLTQTSHADDVVNRKSMQKQQQTTEDYPIEDRVLDSNPILEAFGNAKTVRNDNSSRFGKFIEIQFTHAGHIKSASMVNYLLEKSRLVFQQPNERNYHIFYQICYGFDDSEREKYMIGSPDDYKYLAKGKDQDTDSNMEDEPDFQETKKAMQVLGLTPEEQHDIFCIIAGCLHMGNIEFEAQQNSMTEGSEVNKETQDSVEKAATLFGVNPKLLGLCCLQKTSGQGNSQVTKQFKPDDARKARDTLVKDAYGKFFDWLIWRVNQSIARSATGKDSSTLVLGILDIFGFEIFELNSFEQLCINFTNEKLQQHFNNHIFKIEQQEYQKEGINWESIDFVDNMRTIDLIEKSQGSIFSVLEEECMMPKGSDDGVISKIFKLGSNSLCPRNQHNKRLFGIKHYAGDVYYDTTNFIEKNKDIINNDIQKMFSESKNGLLKAVFTNDKYSARNMSSARKGAKPAPKAGTSLKDATLTAKFKLQLAELVMALNETNPAYIRCIKPNGVKSPGIFDSVEIMRQLKCAGILEAIRIRKKGYPVRKTHQDFIYKYGKIMPELGRVGNGDTSKAIFKKLCSDKKVNQELKGLWALGKTKVFMKEDAVTVLERQLYLVLQKYIKRLQNFGKKIIMRMRWKQMSHVIRIKRRMAKALCLLAMQNINEYIQNKMSKRITNNFRIFLSNKRRLKIREKFIQMADELKNQKLLEQIKQNIGGGENEASEGGDHNKSQASPDRKTAKSKGSFKIKQLSGEKLDLSQVKGDIKDVVQQMQAQIEELRKENASLKLGGDDQNGGAVERLTNLGNFLLDQLDNNLSKKKKDDFQEGEFLLNDSIEDDDQKEKYEQQIEELESKIFEQTSKISSLNSKLSYLESSVDTAAKENQFLREEVKKKEVIRREKMQLEVQMKQIESERDQYKNRNEILKGEILEAKQKLKGKDQIINEHKEKQKELRNNLEELRIQYNSLQEREEWFRDQAAKKDQELKEKLELLSQTDENISQLHNQVKDLSIQKINERDSKMYSNKENEEYKDGDANEPSFGSKSDTKYEEFENQVNQKNLKIYHLTKENQISKEINQTMVKLLKVKNVQIQSHKMLAIEGANKDEAKKNLEKFQNEEKKLLRMLDQLMRQYDNVENKIQQNG